MSDLIQIVTDADGVRDLREVRRQLRGADVTADIPQSRQAQRTIIVEITADIAADDFDPQPADQVVLLADGSGWEKVQPVHVRLLSGAGMSASEESPVRTVAIRMGNLGWCVTQDGGSVGGFALVNPTGEVCDGIGFACDCAIADVVTASCGSGVSPGDQINVWDLCRLWLNMPNELLTTSSFYCQYVKVHEDDYNRPPGLTGECRWIVVGMCCREVAYYGY